MQIGRLVVIMQVMLAGLGGAAVASGPRLTVVQPADNYLAFGRTPFDQPGPTQRVLIRNDGDPVGYEDIYPNGPFEVIASGGGLGTGEVKFWDIACVPRDPVDASNAGYIGIDVCGSSCEDEWTGYIGLGCQAGLLDTPDPNVYLSAYAYASTQETASFTNPGPDSLTITSLATHDPMFSLAPATQTLPVTLAPGDSIDVVATFSPTGSGDPFTYGDVVAGTSIVGRLRLLGGTRRQIAVAGELAIPLGASYSIPITVRNSYPSARMITAVASDHPDDVVTGLVGVILAPGEIASGLLTVTGSVLGSREIAMLTLEFDTGQGDIAGFRSRVVPATYAVTASDATPHDGTIDFGARKAGSAPVEQTFTITNLTTLDQPIGGCFGPYAPFELVGTCPTVLPARGSVQLTVRFMPATPGVFISAVSLGLDNYQFITGYHTARVVASQLAFSSTELAFPDTMQAASAQRHVTITNLADNPITVPITVTGASFAAGAAEVTIAGRETAEVVLEFAPAAPGTFTGTLEIGVAGDPDRAIIALSGTGLGVNQPDDGSAGRHEGGCNTGGSASGLAIAMLALVRRRRRPYRA